MPLQKVQVLLSTFNGERFVGALMDSLIHQDYPNVEILVRDDGSKDDTLSILSQYASFDNVSILEGKNLGVPKSYFELIQISSPDAEYFAFCDQDDIWKEDKISRAVEALDTISPNVPSMYCSRYVMVDEKLNPIGLSSIPRRGVSFENALVQNVASGATIVINSVSRELLLQGPPKSARMHDWWIYQVIVAFGEVVYDVEPGILHRLHSSNVTTRKAGTIAKWGVRVRRFLKTGGLPLVTKQAEEFRRIYGPSLPADKKAILDRFIDSRKKFTDRLRYAVSGEVYRQSLVDNIILRVLIILNRI